jgi:hypothetical protein
VKLALRQTDAHAFATLVESQERHDFLAGLEFNLPGHLGAFSADDSAAVHDGKSVGRRRTFPYFGDLQLNPGKNPPGVITFGGFAKDYAGDDEVCALGKFRHWHRPHLGRSRGGGKQTNADANNEVPPHSIHHRETITARFREAKR